MILPEQFDQNELFVLTSLLIFYSLLFWLPNRFPLSLIILMMISSATVARLTDHLLSGSKMNLYSIMDLDKYELFDFFTYLLYAPFGYFLVYGYDKFKLQGISVLLYILVWALGATAFGEISLLFGVFKYKEWEASYSFTYYFIMISLMLLVYRFFKRSYKLHKVEIYNR
ncbi:hypothetical protein GH741_14735 [Aquibacillus halophilus]|uniref:Uncharacterized protein n=1 Tax=Aquibacillus halophilus TaxID=930132 RepID=A0A6A8DHC3_9BACI|nr:hypothetical protein [Aquibacillus halophilus]MRH43896.1 hypothetical protein [Aquibacillus halophilus]